MLDGFFRLAQYLGYKERATQKDRPSCEARAGIEPTSTGLLGRVA